MSEKTALVFDTNFIIQHKDLDSVRDRLIAEGFEVYITQVAIDERIAQECNKLKEKYERIENIKREYSGFVAIEVTKTLESAQHYLKEGMQKKYEKIFGKNIIPLNTDESSFVRVLERAFVKTPPFIKGSSDKGFKDTLMWISIMEYFACSGENTVVFLTDDNGFRDNVDFLKNEFSSTTGKDIEIKSNSCYKDLVEPRTEPSQVVATKHIVDLDELRDEIEEVINSLCWCQLEDYWGEEQWYRTFTSSVPFDNTYVEQVFMNLESVIQDHLLEKSVVASTVFGIDNRIVDGKGQIGLESLEKAHQLYCKIRTKYSDFMQPFFSAVCGICNQNYQQPWNFDGEELPF